jgi:hypothetical protein
MVQLFQNETVRSGMMQIPKIKILGIAPYEAMKTAMLKIAEARKLPAR